MTMTSKPYQCIRCGFKRNIQTNHFGETYGDKCSMCNPGSLTPFISIWECMVSADGTPVISPASHERWELRTGNNILSRRMLVTPHFRYGNESLTIKAKIELRMKKEGPMLSVTGHIYKPGRRDCEACGCIDDELSKAFPSIVPLIPWHLNDMRNECLHQKAAGIKYIPAPYGTHGYTECTEAAKLQDNKGCPTCHMGEICVVCGHRLCYAWMFHPLPPEILELAQTIGEPFAQTTEGYSNP